MKNILNFVILGFVSVFFSCQNKQQTPKVKEAKPVVKSVVEVTPKIKEVDAVFKTQITAVYDAYNRLKDALVASDYILAKTTANSVLTSLDKLHMSLLKKQESQKVWRAEKSLIKAQLNQLVKSKTLTQQRITFLQISNAMIRLVENFGINKKVMIQYCPMADDFKGGYWLSTDAAIKNPYFGSKMLTCGSTKRIIK